MPEEEKIQASMSQEDSHTQQHDTQKEPNVPPLPHAQPDVEAPKPTETSPESYGNQGKPKQPPLNRYERWSLVVNTLTMIAVSVYAYFAWGQWVSLIDQGNFSIRQFETTERPWIAPLGISRHRLEANQPFSFTLESRNTGKSPGFSFHSFVEGVQGNPPHDDVQRMTFPENNLCDNLPAPPPDGPMILPGAGYAMDYGSDLLPEPVQFEAIHSGSVGLYILGCLRYTDTFSKIHHTKFCYFYSPFRKGFRGCPVGHYAD
jgi:hypothetical protein